jgi:hypothetical protein
MIIWTLGHSGARKIQRRKHSMATDNWETEYLIKTDQEQLDLDVIHRFLAT